MGNCFELEAFSVAASLEGVVKNLLAHRKTDQGKTTVRRAWSQFGYLVAGEDGIAGDIRD